MRGTVSHKSATLNFGTLRVFASCFFFVLLTNFVRPVSNKYGAGRGKGQFEFTFLDVEVTAITRVSALVSAIIYYVPVWLLE